MIDIATAADKAAMEALRDAREGPSHLACSADPDVRHESQHGRSHRIRGSRTWWRGVIPQVEQFIGPLDWSATGHRLNGGKDN
jgi:hypothetical protein